MLDDGVDLNLTESDHSTPLRIASRNYNVESIQFLIRHGADFKCQDAYGQTPLEEAIFFEDLPTIEALLEKEDDIDGVSENGYTP